ncbi:MAG TPA: protein kinase [Candidatus Udaeobacter sp.]|jgi:Tol biopolymer transport system component|nr:protein kinase [Candidatus Udaeobacter sp.]
MPLAPATRLGPYEIVALLGAGGMGEVYRARDTRLGREVAIKVLPAHLNGRPELRARFEREARAISALNHPNICSLFDIGRDGEVDYLVMELLQGETLQQRLARGRLTISEALRLGAEIGDALDRAHRAGIVHRDLKPGNVILTKSGAKLLDFGLATLELPDGGILSEDGRTLSMSLTESGVILGTVGYLAPEQVRGLKADPRSDLFALGAILFEAVSGRRAFQGDTPVATLYAILNEDPPPLTSLEPRVPPALDRAIRVCLARDPDERWQSAADLARELRWIAGDSGRAPSNVMARPALGWWPPVAAAAIALIAGLWLMALRSDHLVPRVISSIDPPSGAAITPHRGPMVLSNDGRTLAFVAVDSAGTSRLWLRALDNPEPRALEGTEGAASPFWSPDDRSVGFFARGKLQRIEVAGGPPQALTDAPWSGGGSWGRDGTILYAGHLGEPIMRIPAAGGSFARADGSSDPKQLGWQAWPAWLPDGRHYLFFAFKGVGHGGPPTSIYVGAVGEPGDARALLPGVMHAIPAGPDHVMFWRDGALWTQPFDDHRMRMSGDATRVAERVAHDTELGCGLFSISSPGTIAYLRGGASELSELAWVDRAGRTIGTLSASPDYYYAPRLSHDGGRVATTLLDPATGNGDIWVFQISRGVGDRITSDPANETLPIWSARDDRLYWMSTVGARAQGDIHARSLSGTDAEVTVCTTSDLLVAPLDCTPDGRSLVIARAHAGAAGPVSQLALLSLSDHKVTAWQPTAFDERQARLSPDGHWIAWMSDENGQSEVYVRKFPEGGEKWRVSTNGGASPVWRPDGRELFYVRGDSTVMSVSMSFKPTLGIGTPERRFGMSLRPAFQGLGASYDVSADGQRILVDRMVPAQSAGSITIELGSGPRH